MRQSPTSNPGAFHRLLNEDFMLRPPGRPRTTGKAVSFRQLGRPHDAVAAYARYGARFAATDSGAAAYARVAQAFTQQAAALGVHVPGIPGSGRRCGYASSARRQVIDAIARTEGPDQRRPR